MLWDKTCNDGKVKAVKTTTHVSVGVGVGLYWLKLSWNSCDICKTKKPLSQ